MTILTRLIGTLAKLPPAETHDVIVERDLKARGLDRHDLGREKFLDQMREWMETYGNLVEADIS